MNLAPKTLLSTAGHDPSSGAGVTADLAVMAAHGYFGTSAVTALTVQSTVGVKLLQPVNADFLQQTLDFLTEDLPPAGVKIGMLATVENVRAVAAFVRKLLSVHTKIPVVLDPIIRSSSGRVLLDDDGLEVMRQELLPLVDFVTPNVEELSALLGRALSGREAIAAAAQELANCGRGLNVVATGGDREASDFVWLASGTGHWLDGEKIASSSTHGTGCAFSSALLCRLCDGDDGLLAAQRAKLYVIEAIRRATPIGSGKGPMNLLWPLR